MGDIGWLVGSLDRRARPCARWALAAAAATGFLLLSPSARAQQNCQCPGAPDAPVISPLNDSPLPTNGKVLVRSDLADPRIFKNVPMGEEVSTHLEPAGGSYSWLVLNQDLEPAAQYKVVSLGTDLMRFNAWSDPDTAPPSISSVTPSASRMTSDCFDIEVVFLELAGALDDLELDLIVKLELDAPGAESVLYFNDRDTPFISADLKSSCFTEAPATVTGETYGALVTLYDRSGNAAPPVSLQIAFPVPEEEGACSFRGPASARSPGAVALLLAAFALGRRRRTRRASPAG